MDAIDWQTLLEWPLMHDDMVKFQPFAQLLHHKASQFGASTMSALAKEATTADANKTAISDNKAAASQSGPAPMTDDDDDDTSMSDAGGGGDGKDAKSDGPAAATGTGDNSATATDAFKSMPRMLFTYTYLMPPPPDVDISQLLVVDEEWVRTHWDVKRKEVNVSPIEVLLDTTRPFARQVRLTDADRKVLGEYDPATELPLHIVLVIGAGAPAIVRSRVFLLKNQAQVYGKQWRLEFLRAICVCQTCGTRDRTRLSLCPGCQTIFHCTASDCRARDLATRHKLECARGPKAMCQQAYSEFIAWKQLARPPALNLFRWAAAATAAALADRPSSMVSSSQTT